MVAAMELAENMDKGVIVTVFPDSCETTYINFSKFKEYYESQSPTAMPKADN